MQLQSTIYAQPSVVVTFLVLASLPLFNLTKVLQRLCTTHLGRRLLQRASTRSESLPDSIFLRICHALSSTCLRVRLFFPFNHAPHPRCGTFPTPEAEAKYWCTSARYRRHLAHSNARQETPEIPLVTYYAPRLLPQYRNIRRYSDQDRGQYSMSARTFCKWHRMVFRKSHHPTLAEAVERMKYHSQRDLREIQRIARLLPDEKVFCVRRPWSAKYSKMWKRWLDSKGPDIVIVFE